MDKAGNFIGWLHIDGVNLSVALVENALSKVHFTAERSSYYKTLVSAEEGCRQRKEKVRVHARTRFISSHLSHRHRLLDISETTRSLFSTTGAPRTSFICTG